MFKDGKPAMNDEATREALQFYVDLFYEHRLYVNLVGTMPPGCQLSVLPNGTIGPLRRQILI
jgi:hypothetical protein